MIKKQKGWKLRVCIISKNKGFCYYYRLKWPLAELEKRGLVETRGLDWSNPEFKRNIGKYMSDAVEWADVIIFHYTNPSDILVRFNDFAIQNKLPKLFVSEFDDDFTCVHPSNSYYRYAGIKNIQLSDGNYAWKDGELCDPLGEYNDASDSEKDAFRFNILRNKARMAKMFRALIYSDVITCTTPDLGLTFNKWNENVSILPNFINPDEMNYPGKKKRRDHVLIGWQGGDSHHHDLKMIMPALKMIKEKYKDNVKFRFYGAAFVNMYKEINGEHIEWIDPEKFNKVFSEDLIDIGIVPLIDPEINRFNNSKSNIKWLEYSHYAIPSVVSGCKPYVQHIEDGKTGLLAYSVNDWFNHICKLIDDPIYRFKLGSDAKKHVDLNFSIQNHAYKWYDLYMNALNAKVKHLSTI